MITLGKQSPLKTQRLLKKQRQAPLKIALPITEGFRFVEIEHISYIEASGNYCFIHFNDGKKLLICRTLQEMECKLGAHANFVRIHRSFIINATYIDRYVRGKGGYVVLENGTSLTVSNSKKQSFLDMIEYYF